MTTETPGPEGLRFEIEETQCIGCAVCADLCDRGALDFRWQGSLPAWDRALCNGCGTCARQCPTGAIRVSLDPH